MAVGASPQTSLRSLRRSPEFLVGSSLSAALPSAHIHSIKKKWIFRLNREDREEVERKMATAGALDRQKAYVGELSNNVKRRIDKQAIATYTPVDTDTYSTLKVHQWVTVTHTCSSRDANW